MWGIQNRGVISAFVMAGVLLAVAATARASVLQFNYAASSSPNGAALVFDATPGTMTTANAPDPTYVNFSTHLNDNSAELVFNHVVLDFEMTFDLSGLALLPPTSTPITYPAYFRLPVDGFFTISTDDAPANAGDILRVDLANGSLFGSLATPTSFPSFSTISWKKLAGGAGYTLGHELLSQLPGPFIVGSQQEAVFSLTHGIVGASGFTANSTFSGSVADPAPEPASAALLLVGFGSLLVLRRRKTADV